MELIIAQINAQRSAAVASDIRAALASSSVDVLCIQEPYSSEGMIRGFSGLKARAIQPNTGAPMVAIIVNNPDIDVLQLDGKGSRHVIAVQILAGCREFYLISAYFQFSHEDRLPTLPVDPYLASLESYIAEIKRNNVNNQMIIAADVNALSTSWHSCATDERGDTIEEFIEANNLMVLNQPSRHTTYASPSGTSNNDVTLATPGIAGYIYDWHISPDMTISDHNAILFRLLPHRIRATQPYYDDLRFNRSEN